jgi:hypothetical protein
MPRMGSYHSVILLISAVTSWIGIQVSSSDENIPVITETKSVNIFAVDWDNIVGIEIRYRLEGPGVESWWGRDFRTSPERPWSPPPTVHRYRVSFSEVKQPGMALTIHPI